MTVKELIEALSKFDPDMPVCIRRIEKDGYYSDWKLHKPAEFYPGGRVCLQAFERMDSDSKTQPQGDRDGT